VVLVSFIFASGLSFSVFADPIGRRKSHGEGMYPPGTHTLEAVLCESGVLLHFRLGIAEGIRLLCRRGAECDYSVIAEDEPPPVTDARPKLDPDRPEVRHYRAVVIYANAMCQFSTEIAVLIP
jgi:hypothetical protein